MLEAILQAKARYDGSIGIRCSCRAAICGSCGVRINGQPDLACHTHLGRAAEARQGGRRHRGRADGQHARHQGPHRRHGGRALEEDPPRHAVADPQAAGARARVHRAAREHGRRHAVDGLHPVRRLRVGLPVDGGRPGVHRAGGAGQGLPLRRRPARRPAPRAPGGPRRGPARHLRLHALLPVHRRLPEGRRADEPDHAPAPARRQRLRHRGPQQRRAPRGVVRVPGQAVRAAQRGRAAAALLRRRLAAGEVQAGRGRRAGELAAGRSPRRCCDAR